MDKINCPCADLNRITEENVDVHRSEAYHIQKCIELSQKCTDLSILNKELHANIDKFLEWKHNYKSDMNNSLAISMAECERLRVIVGEAIHISITRHAACQSQTDDYKCNLCLAIDKLEP